MGFIDVIVSNDGDLFALGADKAVSELNYHTGECCYYVRDAILSRETMGGGSFKDELPALSCFLGNDFIDRLDGNGPVKIRELMQLFVTSDLTARQQLIYRLGTSKKWNKDDSSYAVDFPEKFWHAYYLHMYAPVFRLHPSCDTVSIDISNPQSYVVKLEPLNSTPDGWSPNKWGSVIGFECDPLSLLHGDLHLVYCMDASPSTGMCYQVLDQPLSQYEPFYEVAHGANPDRNIPLRYWSD